MDTNVMSTILNEMLYCVFNNEHDVLWWKEKSEDFFDKDASEIVNDLKQLADLSYVKVSFDGFLELRNLSDIELTDMGVFYLLSIHKIDNFEYELRLGRQLRDKVI